MNPIRAEKRCGECAFWRAGECRRYPPQLVLFPNDNQHPVVYYPNVYFPHTRQDEIACGEWKSDGLSE